MEGFVYIMKCETFDEGLLKIGVTVESPEKRAVGLRYGCYSGYEGEWSVLYSRNVNGYTECEKIIHNILDQYRIYSDKEIFEVNYGKAKDVLDTVCDIFDKKIQDFFFNDRNTLRKKRVRAYERKLKIDQRVVHTSENKIKKRIEPSIVTNGENGWVLKFNDIDDFKEITKKIKEKEKIPFKNLDFYVENENLFLRERLLNLDGPTALKNYPRKDFLTVVIDGVVYDIYPNRQEYVSVTVKKK